MPYKTVYVKPKLFLSYKGVKIYHTYRDDDFDSGELTYYYTQNLTNAAECFDVRDLKTWIWPEHPGYTGDVKGKKLKKLEAEWKIFLEETEPKAILKAIKAAIDSGELKPE